MNETSEWIRELSRAFPPGTRVVLDRKGPTVRPVRDGTEGTVLYHAPDEKVRVRFDCGTDADLIPGEDMFHATRSLILGRAERGYSR